MKVNNDNFKAELENQYSILIQAEKKEQLKRTIIISIILLLTLISVITSTVFAYLSYKNSSKINNNEKEVEYYYETLAVTYNSSLINIPNLVTNYSLENPKVITIENNGNSEITYDMKLSSIKSSLASSTNLVYTITNDGKTSSEKELPLKDSNILSDIKISPNEITTYIINIRYNGAIDPNYNNYYQANIVVEQKGNQIDLLE